jgi:Putative DNA-binding domain
MVTVNTTTLSDLAEQLTLEERLTCRLMLRKSDRGWVLQAMMAETPGRSSPAFSYDYGHTAFVAGTLKGSRLASWLARNKAGFRGFPFLIPKLQPQVNSLRYPSHVQRNIWLSVPEPFSLHTINIMEHDNRQTNNSPLVAEGSPSFRNIAMAAGELLYGDNVNTGRSEPDEIHVRIVHTEAMIEQVHLHPTSASIKVSGQHVSGIRLEVRSAPNSYYERRLRKAGLQSFPFNPGLPERLWIVLSRNDKWLDYRDLDLRGNRSSTDANLLIDPADNTAQIEGFVFRGENETIEFKREVSSDKSSSFLRTVAAFANASGGVILFGVVNQTGEIKGISGDVQKEKDKVASMIHDILVPQPRFRLESCKVRGKEVIALFIEQGDSPPYGVYPGNPKFCVRRGATTQPATQAEVRGLAQRNYADTNSVWGLL